MLTIKEYNENDVVVILPAFHVRPNANQCVVYRFDIEEYATWRIVSGLEGIALTLFDGKRNLKAVIEALVYLFDIRVEEGERIIKVLIKHSNEEPGKEFLGLYEGDGNRYTVYSTTKFVQNLRGNEVKQELKENKLDVPLSLLFMPSNKCEVNCVYCYSERRAISPEEQLTVRRWLEIIDEAAGLDIDLVTFSGGDPLTYQGIEALFGRMVIRGMKFLVPTKSFISKERADMLADTGMRDTATVQISIDGSTSDIDTIMGSLGYADRAFASIEHMVKRGFFVRTNTVCTPLNIRGVPSLIKKLYEAGVKRASVTNYSRSFFRHDDALFLNKDQIDWVQEEMNKLKEELHWEDLRCNIGMRDFSVINIEEKKQSWKKRSHCSGGKSSMTITANGNVILCEQSPQEAPFIVGSVKRHSLQEVWNSPAIKEFVYPSRDLFRSTVCMDCDEFDGCHLIYGRCFRDALFTYGSPYAPSPNCPRAPSGLRMS